MAAAALLDTVDNRPVFRLELPVACTARRIKLNSSIVYFSVIDCFNFTSLSSSFAPTELAPLQTCIHHPNCHERRQRLAWAAGSLARSTQRRWTGLLLQHPDQSNAMDQAHGAHDTGRGEFTD